MHSNVRNVLHHINEYSDTYLKTKLNKIVKTTEKKENIVKKLVDIYYSVTHQKIALYFIFLFFLL